MVPQRFHRLSKIYSGQQWAKAGIQRLGRGSGDAGFQLSLE
jgi:hypothetical protein